MENQTAFELGIAEFNNGQFFECHDTFEEIWQDMRGEKKQFVQGLIHSAVGIFHATRGNFKGAYSQLSKALDKLAPYGPVCLGVDLDDLMPRLDALRDAALWCFHNNSDEFDSGLIPQLLYDFDPTLEEGLQ